MATQAEAWFRELIKDQITIQAQSMGGYLDGTMMSGDEQAGTYKFPIIGRVEAKALSGAIQKIEASNADMSTVQMTPTDYEASAWYRTQDIYKMGPSHQNALARLITAAIRRQKDSIKWKALETFTADVATQDIGGADVIIDPIYLEQGRAEIAATGMVDGEGEVFCPLPEMAMSQLIFYKEFADARYVGPENAPFSKAQREKMRTVRSVHYFPMPDENFTVDGTDFISYMWAMKAMGAETPWDQQAPSIDQHTDYEGSPWLIKSGVGGCALGIQRIGVKKLRFAKQTKPERPAIVTKAAA